MIKPKKLNHDFWMIVIVVMGLLLVFKLAWAMPDYPGIALRIKGNVLNVRLAVTEAQREKGLSHVKELAHNEGMLFVLSDKEKWVFHTQDVYIPLSIAYINTRRRILAIEDMSIEDASRLYHAPPKTRFALEVNQGWFDDNGIEKGDRIKVASKRKLKEILLGSKKQT